MMCCQFVILRGAKGKTTKETVMLGLGLGLYHTCEPANYPVVRIITDLLSRRTTRCYKFKIPRYITLAGACHVQSYVFC